MGEVYINEDGEPFVLEEDGTLDLSSLKIDYSTISLQGKKSLVDKDSGKTKRAWEKLLDILPSNSLAALGTKQNPLQVKGVQKVESGGCLLLRCLSQTICALFQSQRYSLASAVGAKLSEPGQSNKDPCLLWLDLRGCHPFFFFFFFFRDAIMPTNGSA